MPDIGLARDALLLLVSDDPRLHGLPVTVRQVLVDWARYPGTADGGFGLHVLEDVLEVALESEEMDCFAVARSIGEHALAELVRSAGPVGTFVGDGE